MNISLKVSLNQVPKGHGNLKYTKFYIIVGVGGFTFTKISKTTYRLHQTVRAAFAYEALVHRGWHSYTGERPGLTGVPAGAPSCRKAGRTVIPQRLTATCGFIHQEHRSVDELALAYRWGNYSWNRSGTSCCRVRPGGGQHGGHTAGPGLQAVLVLTEESKSRASKSRSERLLSCHLFISL